MTRIVFLFYFLFYCNLTASGQETFSKIYDLNGNTSEVIAGLQINEDRIFALASTICNAPPTECANLIEFSQYGDIIWNKNLSWIDIGSRSLNITDDKIHVSGHQPPNQENFLSYTSSFDGDSLSSQIFTPPDTITTVWIRGSQKFGQKYILYGNASTLNSNVAVGIAMIVSDSGVDTSFIFNKGDKWNEVSDIEIDENGFITVLTSYRETTSNGPTSFTAQRLGLTKYDSDFHETWQWSTDNDNLLGSSYLSSLEILSDGTMALISDDGSSSHKLQMWGVDLSGIIWRHSFPHSSTQQVNISTLSQTANGDIIGCGDILDTQVVMGTTGYFFKVSSTGQLIWERTLIDNRNIAFDKQPLASFFDIKELNDGSLVLGGRQLKCHENNQGQVIQDVDAWLVRTDSNGCLGNPCNFYNDVTTGVESDIINVSRSVNLYPNPTSDAITVELTDVEHGISHIEYYNSVGNLFYHKPWTTGLKNHVLDIQHLQPGHYWLVLRKDDKIIYRKSFIVFDK